MTNEEFLIVERKGDVADQYECRYLKKVFLKYNFASVQLATKNYFADIMVHHL